jgi:uncharacterized protein
MALGVPDRARCSNALDSLFARCDGIDAALLALRDGRPFADKFRNTVDAGRLAAMTSSLVALGHSVLKELKAGTLHHVLIEGSAGQLVISAVPGTGGLLLLAVLASTSVRLGLVLGQSKICCQEVAAAIPGAVTS